MKIELASIAFQCILPSPCLSNNKYCKFEIVPHWIQTGAKTNYCFLSCSLLLYRAGSVLTVSLVRFIRSYSDWGLELKPFPELRGGSRYRSCSQKCLFPGNHCGTLARLSAIVKLCAKRSRCCGICV